MNIIAPLFLSLFLSTAFSFLAPVGIIGSALMGLAAIRYFPLLEAVSQAGIAQINLFLATFGSGSPLQGLLVIGLVFSVVGGLFDAFAFYRHQQFRELD